MSSLELITRSPEETQALGRRLGKLAVAGDVILLVGKLGAGKTCLTQGIAWGLGIKEYAASPSFVLVRELYGRLPLYHIDFYRLENLEEIAELGLDEYFYGKGVSVVEWAEKALALLPPENMLIEMEYIAENERRLKLKASGQRYREMLAELKQ
jgi:tRNA threonylcarbamoyladenosine biosynthesis protein TsaE